MNEWVEPIAEEKQAPLYNEIVSTCNAIRDMLVRKNRSYGNSALEPVRIFSKASNIEQICVRIDDKLSRLVSGGEYPGDDTVDDLIGYLILLKIARSKKP